MEKKINFKVLIYLFMFLFLGFIVYKFFMLQKYSTENININNELIFNETMNIKYNQNKDFVSFDEMSYFNYFSDYISREGASFKVKYDENGKVNSFYNIAKEKQYIHVLNINSFMLMSTEENKNGTIDYSTDKSMKEFLNKNEIKDDIDLIKYIKNNYYLNSNLFTPLNKLRNNYIINSLMQVAFAEFESITLINGDEIRGYMINIKTTANVKEIHLLHNDNQYIITLGGNEIINIQFINSLLESIKFNSL